MEELSPSHGMRLVQYRTLIDNVVSEASLTRQDRGVGPAKPMTGHATWFGRDIALGRVKCFVYFSAVNWSRCEGCPPKDATPLWCGIYSSDRGFLKRVEQALRNNLRERDPWRFQDVKGGKAVALRIPLDEGEPRVQTEYSGAPVRNC